MVLAGWVAVLAGDPLEAERWAAQADDAVYDGVPVDGTASFDSARAMLRAVMCAGGVAQMMHDADVATAQEPAWSPWRDTALILAGEAHLLAGDRDRAAALFEESSRVGQELGNTDSVVFDESELALLAMDRGRWDEAADRVARALAVVEEYRMYDYAPSVLAFAAPHGSLSTAAQIEELDRQLTRAMRARPSCTYAFPFLAVRSRLHLAKVYLARGDHATARHLLREIDDVLGHRPDLGSLVDEVRDFRALVASGAGARPPGDRHSRLPSYVCCPTCRPT